MSRLTTLCLTAQERDLLQELLSKAYMDAYPGTKREATLQALHTLLVDADVDVHATEHGIARYRHYRALVERRRH